MRDWLRRKRGQQSPATEGSRDPATTITVKERIIAAHRETTDATHGEIAERVGTRAAYAGRVRRSIQNHPWEPRGNPEQQPSS